MLSVRTKQSNSKGFSGSNQSPTSVILDNVTSKPMFKQALLTPVQIKHSISKNRQGD